MIALTAAQSPGVWWCLANTSDTSSARSRCITNAVGDCAANKNRICAHVSTADGNYDCSADVYDTGCAVTALSVTYSASQFTVAYTVQANVPVNEFYLQLTQSRVIFPWTSASTVPDYATQALSQQKMLVLVQVTATSGTFTINVSASQFARAGEQVSFDALSSDTESTLLSDAVTVRSLSLPALRIYPATSAGAPVSVRATFSMNALLLQVGGITSSTPMFTSVEGMVSRVTLTPSGMGWTLLGCQLRVRSGTQPANYLTLSPTAEASATSENSTFVLPASFAATDVATLFVSCVVTRDATEPRGDFVVGFESGTSFRVESAASTWNDSLPDVDMLVRIPATTNVAPSDLSIYASALPGQSPVTVPGDPPTIVLSTSSTTSFDIYFPLISPMRTVAHVMLESGPAIVASLNIDTVVWTATGNAAALQRGQWLCGNDGDVAATCEVANNCGNNFTKPLRCYISQAVVAPDVRSCGPYAPPPQVVSSGCGSWKCLSQKEMAYVSCTDASLCDQGCSTALPITVNTTAGEHLATGPYKQYCVSQGSQVNATVFCPEGIIQPDSYASTCSTNTDCQLHCGAVEDGVTKAKSCASDLTWSACNGDCGKNSTQTRTTYCSATELPIGSAVTAENSVNASMCPTTASFSLERTCISLQCSGFAWRCGASLTPCVDDDGGDLGFGTCNTECSPLALTRNVVCATLHFNGTFLNLQGVSPAACEAAQGPRPAATKTCPKVCTSEWRCSSSDLSVAYAPFLCTKAKEADMCPKSGCLAEKPSPVQPQCVDRKTAERLHATACTGDKPAIPTCDAVLTECSGDFTDAKCDMDGAFLELAVAKTCVDNDDDDVYVAKMGVCVDRTGARVDDSLCDNRLYEMCDLPYCAAAGETTTYSWGVGVGSCLPGCRAIMLQPVLCLATTGNRDAVEVDVSFCEGLPNRPASVSPCGTHACQNGGTCVTVPLPYPAPPTDLYGKCVCKPGYFGDHCDTTASVNMVTFNMSTKRVAWSFADNNVIPFFLSIYIRRNTSIPLPPVPPAPTSHSKPLSTQSVSLFATESTSSQSLTLLTIGAGSRQRADVTIPSWVSGNYDIVIKAPGNIEVSVPITVPPACVLAPCQFGGTCNTETGKCACANGYTGATCSATLCEALACNTVTSTCDLVSATEAVCVCHTGFTGDRCDRIIGPCDLDTIQGTCRNGGARTAYSIVGVNASVATCGACKCTAAWSGLLCDTCGLTCGDNGVANAGCTACECKPGYHGDTCSQSHVTYTVNFARSAATEWFFSAKGSGRVASENAFSTELVLSLQCLRDLLSQLVHPITVKSFTAVRSGGADYLQVRLDIGSYIANSHGMMYLYRFVATLTRNLSGGGSGTAAPTATKSEAAGSLPIFDSLYIERGVGARDENCVDDETVDCPKGTFNGATLVADPPSPPSPPSGGGGLTRDEKIALGVCLGVGGAIIIAFIVYCAVVKSSSDKVTSSPAETEMASTTRHPTEV